MCQRRRMALPAAISCLLLSLLVALTPRPGSCEEQAGMTGSLIKCYDDPAPALTTAANATEFLASLLPLLAELPFAAAPTGFASLSSTGRAFVRGLCFGDARVPPSECRGCLSVAARNLTYSCGATTRRAGIWTDRCFVAYRDTHASSPAEDAFRSTVILRGSDAVPDSDATPTLYSHYVHAWFLAYKALPSALSAAANISGPRMLATAEAADVDRTTRTTVHVLAQCVRDRTAAECLRCLLGSAPWMDWDIDAERRDGGVAAAVVGFHCNLFFNVSTALVSQGTATASPVIITTGGFVAVVVVFILCALIE